MTLPFSREWIGKQRQVMKWRETMTKWNEAPKSDAEWFRKRVEQMDALRARIAAELAQEESKS